MASKWKDKTLKEKFFEALEEGKNQWHGKETIADFKKSVDELLCQSGVALEDTRTAADLKKEADKETERVFKEFVAGVYCAHSERREEFKQELRNEIVKENVNTITSDVNQIKEGVEEVNRQNEDIKKKVNEIKRGEDYNKRKVQTAQKTFNGTKEAVEKTKKRSRERKILAGALLVIIFIAIAATCAVSVIGACQTEEGFGNWGDWETSALLMFFGGIAGALVDVLGLFSGIGFFVYERRTDKKEGVSAKAISEQLDDIQTCIDGIQADGTKLDDLTNAVQTMSEKVEGIGGKAANIVAKSTNISSIVNQISNTQTNIHTEIHNHPAPKKEIVEKPIEVCPRCSVPLLPCPTCGWNGDVNSGVPNSQYWSKATAYNERTRTYKINTEEVILDEYSIGVGDGEEAEVEVLVFGPNVRKIKLSGNDDRDADGRVICNIAKANALFDKIRMVCFAEREEEGYCELGRGIFDNMASDITFMGLQYVKTIGDYCFGGVNDGFESNLNQTCQSQLMDCPEWKSNRPRRTY